MPVRLLPCKPATAEGSCDASPQIRPKSICIEIKISIGEPEDLHHHPSPISALEREKLFSSHSGTNNLNCQPEREGDAWEQPKPDPNGDESGFIPVTGPK